MNDSGVGLDNDLLILLGHGSIKDAGRRPGTRPWVSWCVAEAFEASEEQPGRGPI